jgi:hypothetical protein
MAQYGRGLKTGDYIMTAQKSVDVGNTHLESIMNYTKDMVAANRLRPENAPAFMSALSERMLDTLAMFETVAHVTACAAVVARETKDDKPRQASQIVTSTSDYKTTTSSDLKEDKVPKYSKTAKMREAFTREGPVRAELPAVAAAHRFVTPKRGVGRPRKDAPSPVVTKAQRLFDRAFLAKYPVLADLTAENTVAHDKITILFDGKKLKMIGRHLWTRYGINTDDYKRIYSLPSDYPICAPGYRDVRRTHAKSQGLGTAKVPKTPKGQKASDNNGEVVSIADVGARNRRRRSVKVAA